MILTGGIIQTLKTKTKMKTLTTILRILIAAAILVGLAAECQGQTIAKGDIVSNQPYKVLIEHINRDNQKELIHWEIWEFIDEYEVKADEFMRIKVLFLSRCSGDTLATAYFNGGLTRQKIKQDIILDGSVYEFGTNIYADR